MIQQQQQQFDCVELDELYWFIERKNTEKACKNIYVITMVSRQPRQILGFDVAFNKTSERIQKIINDAAEAEKYCTDGYYGYLDVIYPGKHIYNIHNKKDSFTVEGVNADLRHYILTLARRSRCFARKLENLRAAISVFVHAYNKFGLAKYHYRLTHKKRKCLFLLLILFNCPFGHSPKKQVLYKICNIML